ncbi:hypothetical protein D3C81_1459020 [compost metagenome]
MGDVIVGNVNLHRLDRFDRNWLLAGRGTRCFQAESVVHGHAVNRHRVVARVLTGNGDFTALFVGLRQARVGAGVVLQAARDRCLGSQFGRADIGAGTHVVAVENLIANSIGADFHHLHVGAQRGVDVGRFGQGDIHAFAFFNHAILGNGDGVRTAGTQAACDITAFCIGGHVAGRTGLNVNDIDLRASCRLAVSGRDTAANGRRSVLCERWCRRQCNRQA